MRLPFVTLLSCALAAQAAAAGRETINFSPEWKFLQADHEGAQVADFDDSAWTTVSTPHTFDLQPKERDLRPLVLDFRGKHRR